MITLIKKKHPVLLFFQLNGGNRNRVLSGKVGDFIIIIIIIIIMLLFYFYQEIIVRGKRDQC